MHSSSVPSATVAVSPATHTPTMHTPHHTCPPAMHTHPPRMPPCHACPPPRHGNYVRRPHKSEMPSIFSKILGCSSIASSRLVCKCRSSPPAHILCICIIVTKPQPSLKLNFGHYCIFKHGHGNWLPMLVT